MPGGNIQPSVRARGKELPPGQDSSLSYRYAPYSIPFSVTIGNSTVGLEEMQGFSRDLFSPVCVTVCQHKGYERRFLLAGEKKIAGGVNCRMV